MDSITIVIMLILFILAMIFVFSTALLTPYIGKKNLVSVVLLGLIVGVAGGAFLLSPIVDDIPDFTRTVVEESTQGSDTVQLDLSTNGNLTQIIQNISSINGVQKVEYTGITIKIDQDFDTPNDETRFLTALNASNDAISSIDDQGNNTYFVRITEGGDPQSVLDSIYSTFSANTYAHLRYTSMNANATVSANNVTKIMNTISKSGAVVVDVTGPTEDKISVINQCIPNQTNVVVISAIIGVVVAVIGFFVDTIYTFTQNRRKRKARQETTRDKIKRKTVPGTEKNRKSHNQKLPRRDSIDIFDESFDKSPKQNIGSNKNFKPLNEDDLKEKPEKTENKKRFRKPDKPQENKEVKTDKKDSSNKKKKLRVRPKRKD